MDQSAQAISGDPLPHVSASSEESDEDLYADDPSYQMAMAALREDEAKGAKEREEEKEREEQRQARRRVASLPGPQSVGASAPTQEETLFAVPGHKRDLSPAARRVIDSLTPTQLAHIRERWRLEIAAESRPGHRAEFQLETTPQWQKRITEAKEEARQQGRRERDEEVAKKEEEQMEGIVLGGEGQGQQLQTMQAAGRQLETELAKEKEQTALLRKEVIALEAAVAKLESEREGVEQGEAMELCVEPRVAARESVKAEEDLEMSGQDQSQQHDQPSEHVATSSNARASVNPTEEASATGHALREALDKSEKLEQALSYSQTRFQECEKALRQSENQNQKLEKLGAEGSAAQCALKEELLDWQRKEKEGENKAMQKASELEERDAEINYLRKTLGEQTSERDGWGEETLRQIQEVSAAKDLEINQLRQKEEDLQVKLTRLQAEHTGRDKGLEGLERDLKSSTTSLKATNAKLRKATKEVQHLEKQIDLQAEERTSLQNRLAISLKSQLDDTKQAKQLSIQIEKQKQDVAVVELEKEQINQAAVEARDEVGRERRAKKGLEAEVSRQKTAMWILSLEKRQTELKCADQTREEADAQRQLDKLEAQYKKLGRQLAESRDQHTAATQKLRAAENMNAALKKAKLTLQTQRATLATANAKLTAQLGDPNVTPLVLDDDEELVEESQWLSMGNPFLWLFLLSLFLLVLPHLPPLLPQLGAFWTERWSTLEGVWEIGREQMWASASAETRRAVYAGGVWDGVWGDLGRDYSRVYHG